MEQMPFYIVQRWDITTLQIKPLFDLEVQSAWLFYDLFFLMY